MTIRLPQTPPSPTEVPVRCPNWCTVSHHADAEWTHNVRHVGPTRAPLEVVLDHVEQPARLLAVDLVAGTNDDGTPAHPVAWVEPAINGNGAEMGPADLRELARRLRDHAAAVEDVARELDQRRAAQPPPLSARPRVPPGNHLG